MNVLSLFDGISVGQLAMTEMGLKVDNYFASEINTDSIKVTQSHFPKTLQVGDVENMCKLDDEGNIIELGDILKKLPKIDILLGGSPCQGLSRAKSGRLNLKDSRSKLFFNYITIRDWLLENNNPNMYWLLENVVPSDNTLKIMNEVVGQEPYFINSNRFVPQDRPRLYWTNIPVDMDDLPNMTDLRIVDFMENNHGENIKNLVDEGYEHTIRKGSNYIAWDTSGKGYYSQQNRARYQDCFMNTLTKSNGGDKTRIFLGENNDGIYYRNASVEELEKFQGLPVGYTKIVKAKGKKRGLIGDGWTVDVIKWILQYM